MLEHDDYDSAREDRLDIRERGDRIHAGQWVSGTLLAHGQANFRFEPEGSKSYYVKIRGPVGEETYWGTDFKRAIEESRSKVQIGERVGIRIRVKEKLPDGRRMNRWEVETPEFVVRQRQIAREILKDPVTARQRGREHPELTGSYLVIRGAELLAQNRYSTDEDRKRFVEKVREAIGLPPEPTRERSAARPPVQRASDERRAAYSDARRHSKEPFARE
jgi:hypothetical protein